MDTTTHHNDVTPSSSNSIVNGSSHDFHRKTQNHANDHINVPIYTVDVFTNRLFCGKSAAVLLTKQEMSETHMQQIACELNLPATCFVLAEEEDTHEKSWHFTCRWFTPREEHELSTHAVLGAAHVLFEELRNPNRSIEFCTKAGPIVCQRTGIKWRYRAHFPMVEILEVIPTNRFYGWCNERHKVKEAAPYFVHHLARLAAGPLNAVEVLYAPNMLLLMVVVDGKHHTRYRFENYRVDCGHLLAIPQLGGDFIRAITVTMRGTMDNGCVDRNGQQYDYVSRWFSPWTDIDEAKAEGTAQLALAAYWTRILNATDLYAKQCHPSGSGGTYRVSLRNDGRVDLVSDVLTVTKGTIMVT